MGSAARTDGVAGEVESLAFGAVTPISLGGRGVRVGTVAVLEWC